MTGLVSWLASCADGLSVLSKRKKIALAVSAAFTVGATALYTWGLLKVHPKNSAAENYATGIVIGLVGFPLAFCRPIYRLLNNLGYLDGPVQSSRGAYYSHSAYLALPTRPSCWMRLKQVDWFAVFCCTRRSSQERPVPVGFPTARPAVEHGLPTTPVRAQHGNDWTYSRGYQAPEVSAPANTGSAP